VRSHATAETGAYYDEVEIKSILLLVAVGGTRNVRFARSIP
jgi:hypothetical protein